jgi:quinol monooxygenase YgiN
MFLTMVRIFPHSNDEEAVRGFLAGVLGQTRVQPGCLGCTLATEYEPDALLYTESWQSKDDLLRRLKSGEYAKILESMELSTRKPEVYVYEVINQQGLELIERVRMSGPGADGTSQ